MADKKKDKKPFFKNPVNIVLLIITAGLLVYMGTVKGEDGYTGLERLYHRVFGFAEEITVGCGKPPDHEVEAHFNDKAGSIPVDPDFDIDPGEICGNGKSYYCTSRPPKKPIPFGWNPPPRHGEDPDYEGPSPFDEFKESPYAMPSPKITLARGPIRDLEDPGLLDAILDAVGRGEGKIGFVGERGIRSQLSSLEPRIVNLDVSLFDVDDDEKLATQLEGNRIEYVLVDRTVPPARPWMEDKYDTVRYRMRDGLTLDWFHPVVFGSGYALFKRAAPFRISKPEKRRLTARARQRLRGEEALEEKIDVPLDAVGDDSHRVIVSLRKRSEPKMKGRKLIKRMAHGATVIEALDDAVDRIRKDWGDMRRSVNRSYGAEIAADIRKEIDEMEIDIDVLHDVCTLTDRRPENLLWYLELGLEGLMAREKKGDKNIFYLEPSYAVHMEVDKEVKFLERMLEKNDMKRFLRPAKSAKIKKTRPQVVNEAEWRRDKDHVFQRFASANWVERPRKDGGDIVELYRGVPLKTIWDVTRSSLVRSLELGAHWLMTNQSSDGQYAYKYTPTNKPGKRWLAGGNIVRHALNPYTLLMVNKIKQDPRYVESAKKGIEFSLSFLRHKGDRCVICHRDPPARYYNAKLNAVAVTILSILKLGDVSDISEYEDVLSCMANEMLYMQDKNGHYWQYDVPPDHPYYGAESTIHAGEFVFVLARLYSHFKDEKYKKACDNAVDFYMKQWRKMREERTPEGIYDEEHRVNLIGIVPWLVTAMQDLYKTTGDQKYADIAFETQDWIDNEFFWWLNRAQYPDYVGASFKVHRELPAVNSCQYAEGASAAYDIAKRTNHDVEKRRQVVVHSMRYCLQLQYEDYDTTFFLPVPEEAMGAYRYTLGHLRLRNDYNYHAMAALAQAVEYLEPEDYPASRPLHIPPILDELLGEQPGPEKDVTLEEYRETVARKEAEEAAQLTADAGVVEEKGTE